jgi:pimeloyl-ACP methyl ester carboxylesterase
VGDAALVGAGGRAARRPVLQLDARRAPARCARRPRRRLLVWDQDDRLVPLAYADEFAQRLSHARVEVIEGAGHAPHLEQPAVVAPIFTAFLGS